MINWEMVLSVYVGLLLFAATSYGFSLLLVARKRHRQSQVLDQAMIRIREQMMKNDPRFSDHGIGIPESPPERPS